MTVRNDKWTWLTFRGRFCNIINYVTMCQLRYTHSPGHFWDFKILLRSRNVRTFIYGNLRQKRIYYLVDFVDHCTKSHLFLNLVTLDLYLKAIPVCVTQAGQAGTKLGSWHPRNNVKKWASSAFFPLIAKTTFQRLKKLHFSMDEKRVCDVIFLFN